MHFPLDLIWNTKKTETGFKFIGSKMIPRTTADEKGHFVDTEIVKQGTRPTRARAKAKVTAQKWYAYYRQRGE